MRMLKVRGTGHISAKPDVVSLSFQIEVKAKGYAECLKVLNERTADLRKRIESAGLEKRALTTTSLGVRPDSKLTRGRRVLDGFSAGHRMHIELPLDVRILNKTLRSISRGLNTATFGMSFSVKDKDALRRRALEEAVGNAKKNAEALAKASGISLGDIQEIEYGWAEVHIQDRSCDMAYVRARISDAELDTDLSPQDVDVEDSVTLIYEIAR